MFLVTVLAIAWGVRDAQANRGYDALGGEFLSLLIPPMYYIVKQMAMDWIADIRAKWNVR